ncbi:MAG: nucleotidyltransferase family protein [Candidatus Omnitrophica bacterium]|nr:nucleotidyltransferase family protein [Candidatus Omnitrophota bacterium]
MLNATSRNAAKNICAMTELARIIRLFRGSGIPVIVIKGAALAETVYDNIGEREFSDLDILVKEADIAKAVETLLDEGYQRAEQSQYYFINGISAVDLHSSLPHTRLMEEVWREAVPALLGGEETLLISPEENIIYLSYHSAVQHADPDVKWLMDIDRIVRRASSLKGIDWDLLREKAGKNKLRIPVYWFLKRTCERFHTPIPEKILNELKPRRSMRSAIFERITGESPPLAADYLSLVLMRPGRIFKALFPRVEAIENRYGAKRPFAYVFYFVRPFELLFELTRDIFSFLKRPGRRA